MDGRTNGQCISVIAAAAGGKILEFQTRPTRKLLEKNVSICKRNEGAIFSLIQSPVYRSSDFCHSQRAAYVTPGCNNRATTCVKSAWQFSNARWKPKGRLAKTQWKRGRGWWGEKRSGVNGAYCSAVIYCLIRQPWYSGLFGSIRFWSVVVLTQNIAARKMIVGKRNQLYKIFASKFYNCLQLVSKQTGQHILSAPSMLPIYLFFKHSNA